MPFITRPTPACRPIYELLEVQDLGAYTQAQAKRDRDFKILFSVCLLSAATVVMFLVAAYGLRLPLQ